MPPLMRLANKDDAAPVQEIYAPIVRDTATSFETEVPDVIEMRRRISSALEDLPWLVCESEGRILGYAYAGAYCTGRRTNGPSTFQCRSTPTQDSSVLAGPSTGRYSAF